MLVVYTDVHFGRIILLLHLIWLELHPIMSTELSWGLKGCMDIVYLVNMSTIVLMGLINSEKINFQSERSLVYELKYHYCTFHIITVFYVCQPFVCKMES